MVDHLFLLAVAALGWGLSLATYRLIAQRTGWPLGALQAATPAVPLAVGILSLSSGLAFAATRGPTHGALVIIVFGLALGVFWTGFLRVGAQTALLLAPAAAILLLAAWLTQTLAA